MNRKSNDKHPPIGAMTHVTRADGVESAPVDNEIVFLSPTLKNYLALDEIGREIWDLLESPQTFGDLVAELGARFEGSASQIAADVRIFLNRLRDEGLITLGP